MKRRLLIYLIKQSLQTIILSRWKNVKQSLQQLCARAGILAVDLAPAFRNREAYGQVFINLHHYGPLGNQLIADELYKYINEMNKTKCIDKDEVTEYFQSKLNDFGKRISDLEKEKERFMFIY